jgi:predicted chitinase
LQLIVLRDKVISMQTFAQKPRITSQRRSANQSRSERSDRVHVRSHHGPAVQAKGGANRCACGGSCPRCTTQQGSPIVERDGAGADPIQSTAQIRAAATFGTSDAGGLLPYAEPIQESFGRHDVSGVVAHTDTATATAARAMRASAFAAGERGAFNGRPDLYGRMRGVKVSDAKGSSLPAAVRSRFETRFGQDFSDVRVHEGSRGADPAQEAQAAALTFDSHIHFAAGRYRPGTREGDSVLAHELAHVVQQRRPRSGSDAAAAEREADAAEHRFAADNSFIFVAARAPKNTVLAKALTPQDVELSASSRHGGTPMTQALTVDDMQRIYPMLAKQTGEVIDRYTDLTNRTFTIFKMDTVESRAFFLAQGFKESGQFSHMVEGDIDPASAYNEQEEGGTDRNPFYTNTQLSEYRKRYASNQNINPDQSKLPKNWSGPKTNENFAYIGRGPVQVTGRRNYENAAITLERWGNEYEKKGDPPGIKPEDLPGTGPTVAARLKSSAQAIRDNPALAGDPDYAFLLSGAFMKMGWYGTSDTSQDATSLDRMASRTPGAMTAGAMYGKSGLMHGKANVKWPTDKASEAAFAEAWGKDTDIIKGNFEEKAKEYNRIRGVLLEIVGRK